jgi:hypothetical protein
MDSDPPLEALVEAGARQPIPPAIPHALTILGPVVLEVEFFVATTATELRA